MACRFEPVHLAIQFVCTLLGEGSSRLEEVAEGVKVEMWQWNSVQTDVDTRDNVEATGSEWVRSCITV
jgi:hypothetical protein